MKNYGWYWLLIGILLIMAGFAVLKGSQVGRWFGIVAAAVGAIGTMARQSIAIQQHLGPAPHTDEMRVRSARL